MTFTRALRPIRFDYEFDGELLTRCEQVRDLGVVLDSKMLYKSHVEFILEKANRMLGFILRVSKPFKCPLTARILYYAFVRSQLEFSSVVWSPQYVTYIDRIEAVQRRFVRHLSFLGGRYFDDYGDAIGFHGMTSLEDRRTQADMIYLFKIINGDVDSSKLLGDIFFHCPSRNTRTNYLFKLPPCRTNYLQSSFLQRSCSLYNTFFGSLDIFSLNRHQFRRGVGNLLSSSVSP
jgi:hypothetical protein